MTTQISPLAPDPVSDVPVVKGVRFASAAAGVKYQGRDDVMLALLDAGTTVAGVFTTSATRSAPVLDCQDKIGATSDLGAAILVNAGNANAFTGAAGERSVEALCAKVAEATGLPKARVFTASTGVIGERLPDGRIVDVIDHLAANAAPNAAQAAAAAIMTTDTFPKVAAATIHIDGVDVSIVGIAKGSGMIAPDMATMLAYIFTDARVAQDKLQALTTKHADATFNCITVDSDTSTSDTLMVAATGAAGVDASDNPKFADALGDVMRDLAHQVVRDGEGATKFVTIHAKGAHDRADAHRAAMAVANSPLVKTAIAGEDPNWGRIVMAIGKSGAQADRDKLSIWFGDTQVADQGWVSATYREEDGAAHMTGAAVEITFDLGIGHGEATVWTCDLTHRYIEINADYRS